VLAPSEVKGVSNLQGSQTQRSQKAAGPGLPPPRATERQK
jgi:hypothetical protein